MIHLSFFIFKPHPNKVRLCCVEVLEITQLTDILKLQNLRMPRAWRKCSLCPVNSYTRPDLVIFSTTTTFNSGRRFVCQLHYKEEDMRAHQTSRRYATCVFYVEKGPKKKNM